MVIVPGDTHVHEAQHIAAEHRGQRPQRRQPRAVRYFHLKHHYRDYDGDHAVAECGQSFFGHRLPPATEYSRRLVKVRAAASYSSFTYGESRDGSQWRAKSLEKQINERGRRVLARPVTLQLA